MTWNGAEVRNNPGPNVHKLLIHETEPALRNVVGDHLEHSWLAMRILNDKRNVHNPRMSLGASFVWRISLFAKSLGELFNNVVGRLGLLLCLKFRRFRESVCACR